MNNLDLFIKARVENLNEHEETVINFYKKLESSLPRDKAFLEYGKEDFISIISSFNTLTTGTFAKTKSNIHRYFGWLVSRGEMTEAQLKIFSAICFKELDTSDLYSQYYFKNFDDLYASLEEAILLHVGDDTDEGEFDTLRAIIYLAWYGFSFEEMINALKTDIDSFNPVIYKGKNRVPIEVDEKCILVLREYATSNTFMSRRYGRATKSEISYQPSSFLLRTDRSAQLALKSIRSISSRININSDEIGRAFAIKKIFLSGMYYRAYIDELKNGELLKSDYKRLLELFGLGEVQSSEEISTAGKRKVDHYRFNEYVKYKNTFYGYEQKK